MSDITDELPRDASLWERELLAHLTQHVENERTLLESYVGAAEASDSKALAYVVGLLVEDEKRHHTLFQALAETLKHDAQFRSGEPAIPRLDFDRVDRGPMRELTGRLLEREQQDLRELKALQKEISDVKDTTLWALLVDLMQRDTEKHIAVLRFVEKHALT